jgi:hypothetical protein
VILVASAAPTGPGPVATGCSSVRAGATAAADEAESDDGSLASGVLGVMDRPWLASSVAASTRHRPLSA